MKRKDIPIGEVAEIDGIKGVCTPLFFSPELDGENPCEKCVFSKRKVKCFQHVVCFPDLREDKTDVYFKEII